MWAAKKADECEGDTDNEQDDTDSDEEHTLEGLEGTLNEDEKENVPKPKIGLYWSQVQ